MDSFEAIKTLVHYTNDANKQFLEVTSEINNNYPSMEKLANDYENFANSILHKLDEDEQNTLQIFNNILKNINEVQLELFKNCISLHQEQNERTKVAVDIYEKAINYYNK